MKPSREQIAFFKENGYLDVGPALTPSELETARVAYDRIFGATEKPASYRNLGQREGEEVSKGASRLGDVLYACRHKAKRRNHASAPPPPREATGRVSRCFA